MTNQKPNIYTYDIVIVGAGVVGCYAASELAKIGYDVCVLEKNTQAGAKAVCTGVVSKAFLDLFPIGRLAVQHEASSAKIFSPSGKFVRVERESPQAFVLDRPSLDSSMAAQAEKNGAHLRYSTLVTSILRDDKSIQVEATDNNGATGLKARVALIACGAGTSLTRQVGLGQIHIFAQGAQAELTVDNLNEVEVYAGTDIAPGFFSWIVPIKGNSAKVGMLCRTNPKLYMANFLNRLRQIGRTESEEYQINYGIVPLRPLDRTYGERILVVGDAAGQVKTTTGGGIYFGMLCANLAVQTVNEALCEANLSANKLSVYQKRWHRLLRHELSVDCWAHRFYSRLNDGQIEHIFNIIAQHGILESILASPDVTFDWHGKVILDALKHRSLQRSLEKLGIVKPPHDTETLKNAE